MIDPDTGALTPTPTAAEFDGSLNIAPTNDAGPR